MGYTRDAIKGISWLGIFRIITRLLSYVKIAVIARILSPAQYGLSDIALLVLSLSEILTETGINIFLTQRNENIDRYINTAWVVSLVRGLLIAGVIIVSSPFVAGFFNAREAIPLLLLVSVVPILRGCINPSVVKFLKDLQYKKEFMYRSSIFLVETLTAVVIVTKTGSPAAIIGGLIAGAVFEVILSFLIVKPWPKLQFDKKLFHEIVHSGKWLTATGIFNYLYHNGDTFVVGRMLGKESIGLYSRAYSISMLPISEVSDVVSKVTLPVYVRIADDRQRLLRAYIKALFAISVLALSMGSIFYFYPDQIIRLVLGDQWVSAAPALQVLAIFGVVRAISISSITPFYALKRQDLVTRITFVSFLGLAITSIPFIQRFGIVGAAYAALFGSIFSLPLIIYYLIVLFSEKKR